MADDRGLQAPNDSVDEEEIIRTLALELEESFIAFLHEEIGFDDLTFGVFDTLQAVHAVQSGSYSVEYVDDETPTQMQEELAQKPARTGSKARRGGPHRK